MFEVVRELWPVVAALYLLDGLYLISPGTLLLATRLAGAAVLHRKGLHLAGLLPGQVTCRASGVPVLWSEEGIFVPAVRKGAVAAVHDPEAYAFVPYEEAAGVEREGTVLRFRPGLRLRLPADAHARDLAAALAEVAALGKKKRRARAAARVEAAFDLAALRVRREAAGRWNAWLEPFATALFVVALGLLPALAWGGTKSPRVLVAALLAASALYAAVVTLTTLAARRLRRAGVPVARGLVLHLALSPPSALRAPVHLVEDLFPDFDALTVAADLLPREAFVPLARAEVVSLRHALDVAPAEMGEGEAWHRACARRLAAVRALLAQAEVTEEELLAAPPRRDPSAAARCPRCEGEFRPGVETCPECGLPLVPFADGETREPPQPR